MPRKSRDPRRSSFFDSPPPVESRSRQRKRKTPSADAQQSTVDGFTFRKKGKSKTKPSQKAKPAPNAKPSQKAKSSQNSKLSPRKVTKPAKRTRTEPSQPVPSIPESTFQPKAFPEDMPEPAKFQKLMEDMDRDFLNKIKEQFKGDHAYIAQAVSDTIDEFLNNSREQAENEIKISVKSRSKFDEEIQRWREIEQAWRKKEEEPIPEIKSREEPEGIQSSKSIKKLFQEISVKGEEALQSLRKILKSINQSHKTHGKIASLLNHKAFGIYADSDAPKTLLRQFMS